ncbi:hypothetical protein MLD38_005128 [Melastoma candidum]|uniref:Uncharacterized protein n=1 Tax=Melastoma candidum TaxID=119954 RepID=A0ACB9S7D6_9MYRT|nr:hypothetical protein MLD38_005128 [Melastoma candidum]
MDRIAAAEERIVWERLRGKLNEVNATAQAELSGVQDHVAFNLQKAYFKCAYECFDRSRRQEEISNCVEHCTVPVVSAQQLFENEMAKLQERLNRSLTVCQDKLEAGKLQAAKGNLLKDFESCVERTIDEHIKLLPHLKNRLKSSLGMVDS